MKPALIPRSTSDSIAETSSDDSLTLTIPAGRKGKYRWAQFDDYLFRPRTDFQWITPIHFSLEARCTNPDHQGTWGFGFWNDPFNISLGVKGSVKRLPVLPNCAWFFYASESNSLSFESKLPAQGFLAATFSSPLIPSLLFAPTLPFLPLLINKHFARFARKILSFVVKQDAALLDIDVSDWHTYQINWQKHNVQFMIDYQMVLSTSKPPKGKLGIVIWVDNQYAAFKPNGQIAFGTLAGHTDTTLEIKNLVVK
ncbi:MAG TPA: family 16 glycosylhydrolase [Anaerolineaceae bacterium]|nr:family 16 glycosylhydrolase [Anaerolineaceae bacterium]